MSTPTNTKSSVVASVQDKTQRLTFELSITGNATPASKEHASDLTGVAYLRTEGKTAEADALEAVSFTTADDESTGDSQFGILIDGSKLTNDREFDKVLSVTLTEQTSLATGYTVAKVSGDYKTAGGNIAIDITGTGLDLTSESPTFLLTVEYKE